jgi:hypothetical protein
MRLRAAGEVAAVAVVGEDTAAVSVAAAVIWGVDSAAVIWAVDSAAVIWAVDSAVLIWAVDSAAVIWAVGSAMLIWAADLRVRILPGRAATSVTTDVSITTGVSVAACVLGAGITASMTGAATGIPITIPIVAMRRRTDISAHHRQGHIAVHENKPRIVLAGLGLKSIIVQLRSHPALVWQATYAVSRCTVAIAADKRRFSPTAH